jgi:hypothetical protein
MAMAVRERSARSGLDSAGVAPKLRYMFRSRLFRAWWLAGLAVLAVAQATHAYEHWEIAAHEQCVAHAHADGDHDGGSRHDHGCASHDHAPAVPGGIFLLTVSEPVAVWCGEVRMSPLPRTTSIDQPPRLS